MKEEVNSISECILKCFVRELRLVRSDRKNFATFPLMSFRAVTTFDVDAPGTFGVDVLARPMAITEIFKRIVTVS